MSEEKALTTNTIFSIQDIMSGKTIQAEEVKSGNLPAIKMHHAIQAMLPDTHHLHLYYTSDDPIKLEKGYKWTTIASKSMARVLRTKENGDSFYEKAYKLKDGDTTEFDTFVEENKDAVNDKGQSIFQKGTILLGILTIGDNSCITEIEGCKVMENYFAPFGKALLGQRTQVTINIANHQENMVPSARNKAMTYYGPKNFTQFKNTEIDEDTFKSLFEKGGLVAENETLIGEWVNKSSNRRPEDDQED